MNNLQNYTIDYYRTRGNGEQFNTLQKQANIFGTLKPNWIDYDPNYGSLADIGFKTYRAGNNFRGIDGLQIDTLFCWQDTVEAHGNHELDSLHSFNYHWIFGNGSVADTRDTIAIYSEPGNYLVTLIVSDSLGWSDTLRQYIVKPQCNFARIGSSIQNRSNNSFQTFPNPASNIIYCILDSTWSRKTEIELFNLQGCLIFSRELTGNQSNSIPLGELPSGLYILRVNDENHCETKRVSIIR